MVLHLTQLNCAIANWATIIRILCLPTQKLLAFAIGRPLILIPVVVVLFLVFSYIICLYAWFLFYVYFYLLSYFWFSTILFVYMLGFYYTPVSRLAVLCDWVWQVGGWAGVHTGFLTIGFVLYIGSLPNLAT